jgi:hypothetical protein
VQVFSGEKNRSLETATATGKGLSGDSLGMSRFLNRGSFLLAQL